MSAGREGQYNYPRSLKRDELYAAAQAQMMFLSVNSGEKAACQEDPEGFKFYRSCSFSVWSTETLKSYYEDLLQANKEGTNLLALKYARMENNIPPLNKSTIIDKIVEIEINWVKEMAVKFPHVQSRGQPIEEDSPQSTSIKTYLKGELETYSQKTLELYYKNLLRNLEKGENLPMKILEATVMGVGFSSLEAAEDSLASENKGKS